MPNIKSYKDLIVWQKSKRLAVEIYKVTAQFPKEELYGLTAQMRRSAVSIPSNIAEGSMRGGSKDFLQFLRIARGSAAELYTQIEIAKELEGICTLSFHECTGLLEEIAKMLGTLISRLKS